MQLAILAFGQGFDLLGAIAFSLALSVKMSILLYSPAIAIILLKRNGVYRSMVYLCTVILVQIALSWEFLSAYPRDYLKGAFDFSRQFLYKWTVNWKMLSEETFLSNQLSYGLLICHVVTLLILGHFLWSRPEGGFGGLVLTALRNPGKPVSKAPLTSEDIITWMFTCNLAGITFSRSLHYQFYSWYAYQVPYFVYKARAPFVVKFLCMACVEYAWNTFPATGKSSTVLLVCNLLYLCSMLPVQRFGGRVVQQKQ